MEIRQIGHRAITLADIAPQKSPSFSPNLHKYLMEHGHFFRDGGLLDGVYEVQPGTQSPHTRSRSDSTDTNGPRVWNVLKF